MSDEDLNPTGMGSEYPVEPQHLVFSEYGFPGTGTKLKWDSTRQELQISDYHGESETRTLPTPTRAQWKAFWILLDKAKVWEWQSEYVDEIGICDGGGWSLEISYAGRHIKSGGVNAYPDTRDTNYLPGSPFDVLCTAILMLTHSEFPGIGDNN